MEIEYFCQITDKDSLWLDWIEQMRDFLEAVGVNLDLITAVDIAEADRAHYSRRDS